MKRESLTQIIIPSYITESGVRYNSTPLSYQVFGKNIASAPVVLINHALTGNSQVCGENGWWDTIVGEEKLINTNYFAVIAFNIPGNGYDDYLVENYKDFTTCDIAKLFKIGLEYLKVESLFATIGGSIGGAIVWELSVLYPDFIQNVIPIATDWKANDWLLATTKVQELILNNSSNPIHDARVHAMNLYRTPVSYQSKFNRTQNEELQIANVESWLLHHGEKLKDRFQLSAYKLVNHLLRTIDITRNKESFIEVASKINGNIFIIGVNTDLFFLAKENEDSFLQLSQVKQNVYYNEIQSIHGHDAFLIEHEQLTNILQKVFTPQFQTV